MKAGKRLQPLINNHIFFNFNAPNTVVEPTLVSDLLRTFMGRYADKLLRLGVVSQRSASDAHYMTWCCIQKVGFQSTSCCASATESLGAS
jgi:hypothetical protein